MEFKVRPFDPDKDYIMLCYWWRSYGWPEMPIDHLPENGFICEVDNKPIASGFVYKTDSKICWFEWVLADKQSDRETRAKAIAILIESVQNWTKEQGFKTIFTSVEHSGLIDKLKKQGFVSSDEKMTNLTWRG